MKKMNDKNSISPRRAISYIRFSSPKQAQGGSLERQLEATKAFCQRHNLILDDTLSIRDLGVSAFKGKNTAEGKLGLFIEAVKNGKIEKGIVLVVEALDRLTRDEITSAVNLLTNILMLNIDIGVISDNKILTLEYINKNPYELFVFVSYFIRGNDESRMKSVRTTESINKIIEKVKAKQICKLGGFKPSWYEFKDGKYVLDNNKANVVKRIFDEYISGKCTSHIVKDLVKDNIPKWHDYASKTKRWWPNSIRTFLTNRQVIGSITINGISYDDYLPGIISKDDYNKVQVMLGEKSHRHGNQSGNVNNLFNSIKGLCICEACEGNIIAKIVTKGRKYYACGNIQTHTCDDNTYLSLEKTERWIFAVLLKQLPSQMLKSKDTKLQKDISKLETDIELNEKRINDLLSLVGGNIQLKDIQSKLSSCITLREELKNDLLKLRVKSSETITTPSKLTTFLSMLEKDLKDNDIRRKLKNLIPSFVNQIRIDLRNNVIRIQLKDGKWIGNDYLPDDIDIG